MLAVKEYEYDVFISKNSKDLEFARKVKLFLENNGLSVFLSEKDLTEKGNSNYQVEIEKAVVNSRHLIILFSDINHWYSSGWVQREVILFKNAKFTERRGGNLLVVRGDDVPFTILPETFWGYESFLFADYERLLSYVKGKEYTLSDFFLNKISTYLTNLPHKFADSFKNPYIELQAELVSTTDAVPFMEVALKNVTNQYDEDWAEDYSELLSPLSRRATLDTEEDFDEEEPTESDSEQEEIRTPILKVIKEQKRVIIIGEPGSGKTTTLKKILVDNCSLFHNDSQTLIPIFIPLSKVSGKDDLLDVLCKIAGGHWIFDLLSQNKIIVLFDGLNEINSTERESVISKIKVFLINYPECAVVITSRIHTFINVFNLQVYELLRFSEKEITKFILAHTEYQGLVETVLSNRQLSDLASTPLILNMIITVWSASRTIPQQRGQLFEMFVNFIMNRETKKGITLIQQDRKKLFLSYIAYNMRQEGILFAKINQLTSYSKSFFHQHEGALYISQYLDELLQNGILLQEHIDGEAEFTFIHESYQEFFAALFLKKIYSETGEWPINICTNEWFEIGRMCIDLTSKNLKDNTDAEILLRKVIQHENNDKTVYIDPNIHIYTRAFYSGSDSHPYFKDYLSQYVYINLNNWYNLYAGEALIHTDTLTKLFESVGLLCNKELLHLIFTNEKWEDIWLYSWNDFQGEINHHVGRIFNSIYIRLVDSCTDFKVLFPYVYSAYKSAETLQIFPRIQLLMTRLCLLMDDEYLKYIYLNHGLQEALVNIKDTQFVMQHFDISLLNKKAILGAYKSQLVNLMESDDFKQFLLNHIKQDKSAFLIENIIELFTFNYLSSPIFWEYIISEQAKVNRNSNIGTFKLFKPALKKFLFSCSALDKEKLPDPYWSLILTFDICIPVSYICGDKSHIYYTCEAIEEATTPFDGYAVVDSNPVQPSIHKLYTYRGILKNPFKSIRTISFYNKGEMCTRQILHWEKKHFEFIFYSLHQLCHVETPSVSIEINGIHINFLLKEITVQPVLQILADSQIYRIFLINNLRNLKYGIKYSPFIYHKSLFIENKDYRKELMYYPLSDKGSELFKYVENAGLLGFFPELVKRIGIVDYVNEQYSTIKFRNSDEIKRSTHSKAIFQKGDLVYRGKSSGFHKIHNFTYTETYGFKTGIVFKINNEKDCFIFVDKNLPDYYYYVETDEKYNVGDRVTFFPVLNSNVLYQAKHMAIFVRKEGSVRRKCIITKIFFNDNYNSYVYHVIDKENQNSYYANSQSCIFEVNKEYDYIPSYRSSNPSKVILLKH